ncbi:MAG: ATP-binding protein [Bacteroidales bacterium]|nr:ATP-binding protein [Clostridium sp.]MCM1203659.1 ATP-binding protein [Bacteroidales bacterium]
MAFSNSQYDELMNAYAKQQIENRALEQSRKEEIYAKIPRIAEIDGLIASYSIDAVRSRLKSGTDATDSARKSNHALIAEKLDLLKTHGYPEDYLKPVYTCPLCQDTGRTGNGYCSCFRQAAISLLYRQSNLAQILQVENFEHFDLSYYSGEPDGTHPYTPYENMSSILNKTKSFVEEFDQNGGNLLFYGETGLGKTYLSNCIAKALLDTQHTVLYQTAVHLFENVLSDVIMKKENHPESRETYRYLYSCDLLIIDDLGTEFTNSFVSSELYDILNTRMREKRSTLISTNLNLKEMTERYSDRITTRIFAEYKVYHFYGDNIRLAKRRKSITK